MSWALAPQPLMAFSPLQPGPNLMTQLRSLELPNGCVTRAVCKKTTSAVSCNWATQFGSGKEKHLGQPIFSVMLFVLGKFYQLGILSPIKIPKISPRFFQPLAPHSRSSDDSHPEQIWEITFSNRGRYYSITNKSSGARISSINIFTNPNDNVTIFPGKNPSKMMAVASICMPEKKVAHCMIPTPTLTRYSQPAQRLAVKVDSTVGSAMTSTSWKFVPLKWPSLYPE